MEKFLVRNRARRSDHDLFLTFSELAGGGAVSEALPSIRIVDSWQGCVIPLDRRHGHKVRRRAGHHSIPCSATSLYEEFGRQPDCLHHHEQFESARVLSIQPLGSRSKA